MMLNVKTAALITGLGAACAGGTFYFYNHTTIELPDLGQDKVQAMRDADREARRRTLAIGPSAPHSSMLDIGR